MATSHYFNGKIIKLPGAYSAVKSLNKTVMSSTPYGKALIINTDPDNSFGGSINGELTKGGDALYRLRELGEAQDLLRSGKLYHITKPLFRPSRSAGVSGVSELYYINALTTTAPIITVPLTLPVALTIKVKDEGTTSAGAIGSNFGIASGYGLTIESGIRNTAKFIFKFWRGTFKGLAADGLPYDEISKVNCRPELVCQSPEVATMVEIKAWMDTDATFNEGFKLGTWTDGVTPYSFVSGDKTDPGDSLLAASGTASYASTDLEAALLILKDLDFSALLFLEKVGDSGDNDTLAARLQYFIQSEVNGEKTCYFPGKSTAASSDLEANLTLAEGFDSKSVVLVHGTPRKNSSLSPIGYREFDSVYLNALMVGRILGLPPQVPPTYKNLDIDGLSFPLNDRQKEDCLDSGVLVTYYDNELEDFVILRGVNTLQNNASLQNPDGSSFSIQLMRISAQLNRDLVVNAKRTIFSRQDGTNRLTLSPEYLADWIDTYLSSKVATSTQDNLIIEYGNIVVVREGDAYRCTYSFSPNNEQAFMFFTGFSLI